MKELILSMAIVLLAGVAYAGSVYQITTTTEQDAILNQASIWYNKSVADIINDYKNDGIANLPGKMAREKKVLILQKYDELGEADKTKILNVVQPGFDNSTTIR